MISIDYVEGELDKLDRTRRSAIQNLLLLVVSLAVFAATRILNASWTSAAVLIVVLLVHESGHWLAMRYYGYRDLQMFFIPFFGAAVSGKPSTSSGRQEAIVSLMGPAPGIFLGLACGFLYLKWPQPLLFKYAVSSVFINGLNLLPIYPLDGGRFMEAVLFLRHPVVEVVFKVLAAAALGAIALKFSSIPIGIFALFTALLARESYYQGRIARRLVQERGDQPFPQEERIPRAELERALPSLSMGLSEIRLTPKMVAGRAVSVWRRIRKQTPSPRATAALLAVYVAIFAAGAAGVVAYVVMQKAAFTRTMLVYRTGVDGRTVPIVETFWKQAETGEAQLDREGLYDGPATVWTTKGVKREEGAFAKGYWQGDWRTYDAAGNVVQIRTYENGRPVRYRLLKDGVLVDVSPDQWPYLFKSRIQSKPERYSEKPRPN
jgi:Zn-dependent protease